METGFFRYANKEPDPERVYTTSLISVGFTSLLFMVLVSVLIGPVSGALLLPGHPLFVWLLGITVAIDAFSNIPFAYLRYRNRAFRFAGIKLLNVGLNISLNLFFLLACPALMKSAPALVSWFYEPLGGAGFGIGWIFLANLISSAVVLLCLMPELTGRRVQFDAPLLRRMLVYSWPLLVLGVAGILSQNMGQILIPYLFPRRGAGSPLYGGYLWSQHQDSHCDGDVYAGFPLCLRTLHLCPCAGRGKTGAKAYCDAMKYFVIFGLFIFLAVMYFLPLLKYFVSPILLARPEGGSRDDGGRSLLRSVLQPFSLVQAY